MIWPTLIQVVIITLAAIGNYHLVETAMNYHWSAGLTTLLVSLVCWAVFVNAVFGGA